MLKDIGASSLPPRYDRTIVYYKDDAGMSWLWLENFESALLADGNKFRVIRLLVGLQNFNPQTIRQSAQRFDDIIKPSTVQWCISNWLDVDEIINFQQAVLKYAWQNKNSNRSPSTADSSAYAGQLIRTGLRAINIDSPSVGDPIDWLDQYVWGVSASKHPRDVWEYTKDKTPPYTYQGSQGSNLNPAKYKAYQELGFVGYFPRPDLVLQEQQTICEQPTTSLTGQTKNKDTRVIYPITSATAVPVNCEVNPKSGKSALERLVEALDKLAIKEEKKQKSSSSGKSKKEDKKGTLLCQLDRTPCYTLRGDRRDPVLLSESGFLPNITRSFDPTNLTPVKKERITKLMATLDTDGPESWVEAMIESKVFDLKDFVKNEDYGGFISTTTSLAIAKCFTNLWHSRLPPSESTKPQFRTQAFCYAVYVKDGFHIQKNQPFVKDVSHDLAFSIEQEVANLGMIGWNEVFGFRLCCSYARGQRLAGPVWLKPLPFADRIHFETLYELMSGQAQGTSDEIERSYPSAPFTLNQAALPKRQDVL